MPYESYSDTDYYKDIYQGRGLPEKEAERFLRQASRHTDSLTFNRIGGDIGRLTEKQREIVQEFVCRQAEFEYENRELFDMVLQGYSINGVSMQFGESWNVVTQKGIPVKRDDYDMLCQTGLCCRMLR